MQQTESYDRFVTLIWLYLARAITKDKTSFGFELFGQAVRVHKSSSSILGSQLAQNMLNMLETRNILNMLECSRQYHGLPRRQ